MEENSSKRKSVYNPRADKKWNEENREHRKYLTDRTSARRFIRKLATIEDLEELGQLIEARHAVYPQTLDNK